MTDSMNALELSGVAAEIWAAAQLGPSEGITDGVNRIEALSSAAIALENQQDTIACWGAYASEYFQKKHDLEGDIESVRVSALAARNAVMPNDKVTGAAPEKGQQQ